MCKTCHMAMDANKPSQDGATADAWRRADAAIKSWRSRFPELEFNTTLEESEAWCAHMAETR